MESKLPKNALVDMYKSTGSKKKIKTESTKRVTATSSKEMVVFEADGKKHTLPTHAAFTKLLGEHQTVKNDLKKALGEIKILKDAFNNLVGFTNNLSESLDSKIDKPDE